MKPRATIRTLLALAIVATVTLIPATAWAGCNLTFNPNPGYRGANVTISGFGFAANATYYVNFNGEPIKTGATNVNGAFSFTYKIPNDHPTGTTNVFAFTEPNACEININYTVNATAPTTTTTTTTSTTTTTTIPPTTTTLAPTTTVAAPTTTVAAPTTTIAGDTTTTVGATTTTTVAEEDDGGGIPLVVWIVIGVAAAVILLFLGRAMAGRRR